MSFIAPLVGALGAGAGGIGTALQVGGSILGIASAVGAANYQSQVAKNNAIIAERNAQQASVQAQEEQLQNDQQVAAVIGEQEAEQSASGLTGTSQLRTRRSTARLGRQDSINIRLQGNQDIANNLQQAENFRGEARTARSNAIGAVLGGALDIGSSLIGGSASSRLATRANWSRDPWVMRNGNNLRRV